MKNIQKLMFLSLMYLAMPSAGNSQPVRPAKSVTPEKPFIFNRFPSRFECSASSLKNVFNYKEKDQVSIPLSGNDFFTGIVKTKIQSDAQVMMMNITSTNFPGTMLNLSLSKDAKGIETITGMAINPRTGDMLLIEREGDTYFIKKEMTKFVMAECPLPGDVK